MSQSRLMSFIEAKANAIIGLVVSWLFTFYGLPLFGIEPNAAQATGITACYFILSLGRSYIIRRMFEGSGIRFPTIKPDAP
jgi:hypothetical protein